MTGENLLGSGTASTVMSTLLSLSRCTVEWYEPPDRAARERELDAIHQTPPGKSLARKPIRGKRLTREFHCRRGRAPRRLAPGWNYVGRLLSTGVRLSNGRRYMSKNDLTVVHASKLNASTTAKKKKTSRTAKLKSSGWYEGASRSIGINRNRREKRKALIDD